MLQSIDAMKKNYYPLYYEALFLSVILMNFYSFGKNELVDDSMTMVIKINMQFSVVNGIRMRDKKTLAYRVKCKG